jgi:hypothetical protein
LAGITVGQCEDCHLTIKQQEADTLRMAAKLIFGGATPTEAAAMLNSLGRTEGGAKVVPFGVRT